MKVCFNSQTVLEKQFFLPNTSLCHISNQIISYHDGRCIIVHTSFPVLQPIDIKVNTCMSTSLNCTGADFPYTSHKEPPLNVLVQRTLQ